MGDFLIGDFSKIKVTLFTVKVLFELTRTTLFENEIIRLLKLAITLLSRSSHTFLMILGLLLEINIRWHFLGFSFFDISGPFRDKVIFKILVNFNLGAYSIKTTFLPTPSLFSIVLFIFCGGLDFSFKIKIKDFRDPFSIFSQT